MLSIFSYFLRKFKTKQENPIIQSEYNRERCQQTTSYTRNYNGIDLESINPDESNVKQEETIIQPELKGETCEQATSYAHNYNGIDFEFLDPNESDIRKIRESFVSIDIETTGLDRENDRIIKISAVLFENGEIRKEFSTLVNSNKLIPQSITKINHITNYMLAEAPDEPEAILELLSFISDAQSDVLFYCAYNVEFEYEFLQQAFIRAGVSAHMKVISTLALAKKFINKVENYKLASVEEFYGIERTKDDKSLADAESCGWILLRLLDTFERRAQKEKNLIQKSSPNEQELELCAFIQDLLSNYDVDLSALRFSRDSHGYVCVCCYHPFLKFKIGKRAAYILVDSTCTLTNGFYTENSTESEGGLRYTRVYFSNPRELGKLSTYFYESFCSAYEEMRDDIAFSDYRKKAIQKYKDDFTALSEQETRKMLEVISQKEYLPVNIPKKEKINRSDVIINSHYSRIPASEIKVQLLGAGFKFGLKYWGEGDDARKAGNIDKAISLFDKARMIGYITPALYESYAMAFRKLKEYSDEILILDEAIVFCPERSDRWAARRERALELLYAQQTKNKNMQDN